MPNSSGVKRILGVLTVLTVLGVGGRYALTAIPAYRGASPAAPPPARLWLRAAAPAEAPPDSARFSAHAEFGGTRIGWGHADDLSGDVRVVYVAGRTVGFTWKDGFSGRDIEAAAHYFTTGTSRESGLQTWWECQLRHE